MLMALIYSLDFTSTKLALKEFFTWLKMGGLNYGYYDSKNLIKENLKKKIALLCAALLLSKSAFSIIGTTVKVTRMTKAAPNQTFWIYTSHAYNVINDSGAEQNVVVYDNNSLL